MKNHVLRKWGGDLRLWGTDMDIKKGILKESLHEECEARRLYAFSIGDQHHSLCRSFDGFLCSVWVLLLLHCVLSKDQGLLEIWDQCRVHEVVLHGCGHWREKSSTIVNWDRETETETEEEVVIVLCNVGSKYIYLVALAFIRELLLLALCWTWVAQLTSIFLLLHLS